MIGKQLLKEKKNLSLRKIYNSLKYNQRTHTDRHTHPLFPDIGMYVYAT